MDVVSGKLSNWAALRQMNSNEAVAEREAFCYRTSSSSIIQPRLLPTMLPLGFSSPSFQLFVSSSFLSLPGVDFRNRAVYCYHSWVFPTRSGSSYRLGFRLFYAFVFFVKLREWKDGPTKLKTLS